MKIEVFADADLVAREAAAIIAAEARASVAAHGRFIAAFSGGHTPWLMLRGFGGRDGPVGWSACGTGGRTRGSRGRPRPKPHSFA